MKTLPMFLVVLVFAACATPTLPLKAYADVTHVSAPCQQTDVRIGMVKETDGSTRLALESRDIRLDFKMDAREQLQDMRVTRKSSTDPGTATRFALACVLASVDAPSMKRVLEASRQSDIYLDVSY